MKFIFTVLPLLLLACIACAVNSMEQEFLCPVCGTHFTHRVETSGRARGLRLDLRQTGDVVDPPSLPQCTKCRFPLFSDKLVEQANDPAKAPAFKQLRAFVRGADFQMLAAKNPPYFALAQVQQLLQAPRRVVALSYLRASWQVEDREVICRRLLEKALEHYVAARAEAGKDYRLRRDLALLCGEIERRLGKWEEAERRFTDLQASGILEDTPQVNIPALQLRLIAQRDSSPHLIDGADVVQNAVPPTVSLPEEKLTLQPGNPVRVEKPEDALKLAQPPQPAQPPMTPPDLPLPSGPPSPASDPTLLPSDSPSAPPAKSRAADPLPEK